MSLLCVLPIVWSETGDVALRTLVMPGSSSGIDVDDVLVVDNTRAGDYANRVDGPVRVHRDPDGHNLGCARSWNLGAREVLERGLDWLVIWSASVVCGPELHTTFVREIDANPDAQIVEPLGTSWHAIALSRRILEAVGLFDEAFYPGYEEAIDWGYRQKILGYEQLGWPRVWFNAMSIGHAVHIDKNRWDAPSCNGLALQEYYAEKWGGPKGEERFTHPFDDPAKQLNWFPDDSIPELAKRYGLGERGVGWW